MLAVRRRRHLEQSGEVWSESRRGREKEGRQLGALEDVKPVGDDDEEQ